MSSGRAIRRISPGLLGPLEKLLLDPPPDHQIGPGRDIEFLFGQLQKLRPSWGGRAPRGW
ncbi:MAG: hypothetical protein M3333_01700 [Actinomycetota bacterium]|nr:hypothetical protein [Actinomycetota bacterium]